MATREKVYLKDTDIWDSIDHEASKEQFPETYARLNNLTYGSKKKLAWKCSVEEHGSWSSIVVNRSSGSGCPICATFVRGRHIATPKPGKSLVDVAPDLVTEWDNGKNILGPEEVSFSSHRKVWWICILGHEWEATVKKRVAGTGCPFCSGNLVSDANRLSINRPELVGEWDSEKNSKTPSEVPYSSGKKFWWRCSFGHNWEASPNSRSKGAGCPFCSGRMATDKNRLSIRRPELVDEWCTGLNKISPEEVTYLSSKKRWWVCKLGHKWEARIADRSKGQGCPKCAKRTSKIEWRFIEAFTGQTDFTVTAHGMHLNQLSYASGRSGVEVDIILYRDNHYLLLEYDGNYWHRSKTESDTEKSRLLLSLGDNILHARVRENDLPNLDLAHDRFAQFQHDYHATESDSIGDTVLKIEKWFMEKIGE